MDADFKDFKTELTNKKLPLNKSLAAISAQILKLLQNNFKKIKQLRICDSRNLFLLTSIITLASAMLHHDFEQLNIEAIIQQNYLINYFKYM